MSPRHVGGFLIRIDEDRRGEILKDIATMDEGFSEALSTADWPLREWNVCGLLFDDETVTHWALARRTRRVATAKARVDFSNLIATSVSLAPLEAGVPASLRAHLVRTSSGRGGRVPPATWEAFKLALLAVNSQSYADLVSLERLRDQAGEPVDAPGAEVVSQQRDATGIALDVFDASGALRRSALNSWRPTGERPLTSFLDGVPVRTIEDQQVAHDVSTLPGATSSRNTVVGKVFSVGGRTLEVFNVNRHAIEGSLGVDLLYYSEPFGAWTLVQYKIMRSAPSALSDGGVYRPDASFWEELSRMDKFRTRHVDGWRRDDDIATYRLCADGFFFKFCRREQLVVMSDSLLPGMYVPRMMLHNFLEGDRSRGPKSGLSISSGSFDRHVSNTLFAALVRDAWVGTRGVSTKAIAEIVSSGLDADRTAVIAVERRNIPADLRRTASNLEL